MTGQSISEHVKLKTPFKPNPNQGDKPFKKQPFVPKTAGNGKPSTTANKEEAKEEEKELSKFKCHECGELGRRRGDKLCKKFDSDFKANFAKRKREEDEKANKSKKK